MSKFKFLTLSLFVLFGISAAAQTQNIYGYRPVIEDSNRYHFILEVGYIGAGTTEASDASDLQHGFSGGFLFDLFGKTYFNFETGAFITQQAFSYNFDNPAVIDTTDVSSLSKFLVVGKVTYVGVPLLAKINFSGHPTNTAFLIGGASPQILMAKDMSVQAKDDSGATKTFSPATNKYDPPSVDVSGIIGLGGSFSFSDTQSILVQATYNRGFVPVDYKGDGIYNQSFLLTLGFGVDL